MSARSSAPPLAILAALPPGYVWEADANEVLALDGARVAELAAVGLALGREARGRTSELVGRHPLLELQTSGGERLLLRRLRHGGLLRWAKGERYLDPERPFRELVHAARLRAAGVPTPEIVAARARRVVPFGWRLELVSRRIEGAIDLDRLLAEDRARGRPTGTRRALLAEAGRVVRALHEAGFVHPDLHPGNLLARVTEDTGDAPALWVIDLDRGAFRPPLGRAPRERMLARAWRWMLRETRRAEEPPPTRAALRFLAGYEPEAALRRVLARRVAGRARRAAPWHALGRGLERLLGGRRAPRT